MIGETGDQTCLCCLAMTCSCAKSSSEGGDSTDKEPSIIEEFDPYTRSWHGSQYGSRSVHLGNLLTDKPIENSNAQFLFVRAVFSFSPLTHQSHYSKIRISCLEHLSKRQSSLMTTYVLHLAIANLIAFNEAKAFLCCNMLCSCL